MLKETEGLNRTAVFVAVRGADAAAGTAVEPAPWTAQKIPRCF